MPATESASSRDRFERFLEQRDNILVVAHRGTTLGSFPDNTIRSGIGAVRSGADIVEADVMASSDGEYFLFHTGYERKLFGEAFDVRDLDAESLTATHFRWQGAKDRPGVERLRDYLSALPDVWINIDRSWHLWPGLLDTLTELGAQGRVLLKSPPQPGPLAALAAHPTNFLYFPIVRTPEELAQVEAMRGINLVGAELLAEGPSAPFADPYVVADVRSRHPLVLLNAINLENGSHLYLDYDDEASLLKGPEHGWGKLLEAGATAIQTDWPHLVRQYLSDSGRRG